MVRRLLAGGLVVVLSGCPQPIPDAVESSFDFRTHAFSFINFDEEAPAGRLTPALAARMFGAAAVCASGDGETCEPTAAAALWIDDVNATLANGHSEGMAVLAQLFALGKLAPADFGADTVAGLSGDEPRVLREIAYWAATQRIVSVHAEDKKFAAKEVMPFLAQALKPGQAEMWRLLIAMREPNGFKGGHALVPFGYFKGEGDGQYVLRVYDSNFPQEERRLFIDVKANTWAYEGGLSEAEPRAYVGNPENGNLLYFSPVTRRLGVLPAPFAGDATALMVSSSNLSVLLQDSEGAKAGFENGQVVESGGSVLPGAAACACKAPHQVMNTTLTSTTGTQSITVNDLGTSQTGGTLNVTGQGMSATVTGVKADPAKGTSDTMTVSKGGKEVRYESGSDGAVKVTTTTRQADGSTTTVTVTVSASSNAVTVDASNPSNVVVSVEDAPTNTTVQVEVSTTSASGQTQTTTSTATTTGMDAQVQVDPVMGTSQVNTSIELELCLNEKKDPLETDVDCGQVCMDKYGVAARCKVGQGCSTDPECDSYNCVNGTCMLQSCTDGRLNNAEGDVDCGGYASVGRPCPRCALGKRCTTNAQCESQLCAQGVCTGPSAHFLEVHGLEAGWTSQVKAQIDGAEKPLAFTGTGQSPLLVPFEARATFGIFNDSYHAYWAEVICSPVYPGNSWDRATDGATSVRVRVNCRRQSGRLEYTNHNTGCNYRDHGFPWGVTVNYRSWKIGSNSMVDSYFWNRIGPSPQRGFDLYPGGTLAWEVVSIEPRTFTNMDGGEFREDCVVTDGGSGAFPDRGRALLELACTCTSTADAGVPDAGPPDAGPEDAGVPDAGTPDAGAMTCVRDSECPSQDCECGANSGNCVLTPGRCGAGKQAFVTPTADGLASSGSFTVPANCPQVYVQAWGAGGGASVDKGTSGGPGGFVAGALPTAAGDVLTVWVGEGGYAIGGFPAQGSWVGAAAPGGRGDGDAFSGGGGGGGLTSLRQTGSAMVSLAIPAGAGGTQYGTTTGAAGDMNAGGAAGNSGGNAAVGSTAGGGGAGQPGGLGGSMANEDARGGAFGALPAGFTTQVGGDMFFPTAPPNGAAWDYGAACTQTIPNSAGKGGGGDMFAPATGGNGCVVLRCVAP